MSERFEVTIINVGPEYSPHIAGTYVKINKVIGLVKGVPAYGEQIIAKKTNRTFTLESVDDDGNVTVSDVELQLGLGEFDIAGYLSDQVSDYARGRICDTTYQKSGMSASTFQSLVKAAGIKVYKMHAY